jgi:hypothetical protein
MQPRQRVLAAFKKQPTDLVPIHHLGFSSSVASALLGREAYVGGGIQQWREATALWAGPDAHQEFLERSFQDAVAIAKVCQHDIVRAAYWRYPVEPTRKIDDYTFAYEIGDEADWRVLRYDPASEQCDVVSVVPQAEQTLDDLEASLKRRERAMADYTPREEDYAFEIRAQRLLGQEYVVRVGGVGVEIPVSRVWLEATLLRPDLVERHLDLAVERARRNVGFLSPFGFRFFFGGGDLAGNDGPMYSPRTFARLLLPRLQQITEICHAHGAYYMFASDGCLWPLADDLFGRSGIDGYLEIDRRAGMDLPSLRRRFPDLTLVGNISSHTAHRGSREEAVAETRECLAFARDALGVIVGTSNYFVPNTPVENVEAILATIRDLR